MTQLECQDSYLSNWDFSPIGNFRESKIEGIIADVFMEEGGDFETRAAFEQDGNRTRKGYLRLYHRQKYSTKSGDLNKMNLDYKTCKNLLERLKTNEKFTILENDNPHGFGDGVDYWTFTILESDKLKVIYAQDYLAGSSFQNDISIIDKEKNICVYSNSPYPRESGMDKMERRNINTLDELTRYLAERLEVPI